MIFSRRLSWRQTTGSVATEVDQEAFGLKEVMPGQNPILDIVAIHGLNGHRDNTWVEGNTNWLKDLLPEKIPNVRIFSYGYDARTHGFVSQQYLHDHGNALVADLSLIRRSTATRRRPIIFIAHSLGGIVCKNALVLASAANEAHLNIYKEIYISTYGILFFGTPHQGGNGVSLGKFLVNVASIFTNTNKKLLKHLELHSEWLLHQTAQYNAISAQFETKYIYETYKTETPFGPKTIVPKFSAVIPGAVNAEEIAINKNHVGMVRFHSDKDEGFKKISLILGLMVSEAAPRIENKWRLYDAQRSIEPTGLFNGAERINITQHETSNTCTRMLSIEGPRSRIPLQGSSTEMQRIRESSSRAL